MSTTMVASHAQIQLLRRLSRRRSLRHESNMLVLDTPTIIATAIDEGIRCKQVFISEHHRESPIIRELEQRIRKFNIPCYLLNEKDSQSVFDIQTFAGIAAIAHKPDRVWHEDMLSGTSPAIFLVLADLSDPGNVGTCIRSAAASGITAVLVSQNTADIFAPKTIRSSAGALFQVPVINLFPKPNHLMYDGSVPQPLTALEIISFLNTKHIQTMGATLEGQDFFTSNIGQVPTALIIGNEAHGLSEEIKKELGSQITIPLESNVESINAAMAATILCFEMARQRRIQTNNTK